ncbi:hypothetical protein GQR58_023999 [Nymphon striatum]|nr:hypothetical protein GQR58_023999 [Nymphon striatum]
MINFSDVMTLVGTGPMFIIFINGFLFKIKPTVLEIITVTLCVVSITLCTQPDFIFHPEVNELEHGTLGKFLALLAAFAIGLLVVLYQHTPNLDCFIFMTIHHGTAVFLSLLFMAIFGMFNGPEVPPIDYAYLISNGIVSTASVLLYLVAVRIDSALMASIGRTSDVLTGLVYGVTLFHQVPNALSISAAVLLVFAIILPALVRGCLFRSNSS